MRITPIPKLLFSKSRPTFYDVDSVTGIEAVAKLQGKVNEIIDDYNNFIEETNRVFTEFAESNDKNLDEFETALRQEFQDFIDTVTLKLDGFDGSLDDFEEVIDRKTKESFANAINSGYVVVEPVYNEETEELTYKLSVKEVN